MFKGIILPSIFAINFLQSSPVRIFRKLFRLKSFFVPERIACTIVGATLNFSDLAANCGVSVGTAKSWLGLLETSFILFRLPSYHDNLGRRVTKSPKLYFYDVGLAAALMGIDKETIIKQRSIYGALFENMVIVDLIKAFNSQSLHYVLTFYRDTNKNEIDLIIETGGKVIPVEIKASETMSGDYFNTIAWFREKAKCEQDGVVVYGGNQNQKRLQGRVISWKDLKRLYREMIVVIRKIA